jgi:hypothetical protein
MATPYPYNTDYIVYPDGRVWTTKKRRFMKVHKDNSGYLHISFYLNRKKTTRLLHRVVLETFDGPCPEGMEARHLDGDKENNNILNLVWGTREENMEDVKEYYKRIGGQNNANAKLTAGDVKRIRKLCDSGVQQRKIAEIYRIDKSAISRINTRENYAWVQ